MGELMAQQHGKPRHLMASVLADSGLSQHVIHFGVAGFERRAAHHSPPPCTPSGRRAPLPMMWKFLYLKQSGWIEHN